MDTRTTRPDPRIGKARLRKVMIDLTIMTAIGVILALIGPFGSFAEPLVYRLISWVGFSWIGYALFSPMGPLVDRVAQALDLPRAPLWAVAAAISSVAMTAVVHTMGYLPGPVPIPSLEQFFSTYPYVFVIGGGVTALFYLLGQKGEGAARAVSAPPLATHPMASAAMPAAPAPEAEPTPLPTPLPTPAPTPSAAPNPLFDALPAELGSDVIALEMEDHYVRVHTALGSELVLMRLRDAMACVSEIEGRQVHRSWWVARLAIEDVKREGRNVRLVLPLGIEAPVSRAQVSELRDAGWI